MIKKKVLLVDDVRLFLEQEMNFLGRDYFSMLVAYNGFDAMKIIMKEMPDIVFMDLYMPHMDGDKCCCRIKSDEKLRQIPIIMVTQGSNKEDFNRCWQAGCDDVITKPINRDYFMAIAKKHLGIQIRRENRYLARLRIQYVCGVETDRVLSKYSINLSTGGIFLETAELLPIDSQLEIQFTLPEDEKKIKCSGRVSWLNHPESIKNKNLPVGMGIQFVNISLNEVDSIRYYIKNQSLTPEW